MEQIRYKTGLKRVGAAIVDSFVMGLLTSIPILLTGSWKIEETRVYGYFTAAMPLAYSIIGHYRYGMTIGKWVTKIKVIDVSETRNITLMQAVLRDIVFVILTMTDIVVGEISYATWQEGEYPEYIIWITAITGSAWLLWTLLEVISMLTNNKRRAIHDFMAGTVVVRTEEYERSSVVKDGYIVPADRD